MKPKLNQLESLEHIMNVFGKRILPGLLFSANPELFLEWQGNICKQTAILGSYVIKQHLPEDYIEVQAWEGFFEHEKLGAYNHCWNYLIHKDDPRKNIICDFTSTISYFDYCSQNDPTLHLTTNMASVNKCKIDMIALEQLDINKEFIGPEFYTEGTEQELKNTIKNCLKRAKLWDNEKSKI